MTPRTRASRSKGASSWRGRFVPRQREELAWGYAVIGHFIPRVIAQLVDLTARTIPDGRRVVVVVVPNSGDRWEQIFYSQSEARKYVDGLRNRSAPSG
jgi:hypothetical protein